MRKTARLTAGILIVFTVVTASFYGCWSGKNNKISDTDKGETAMNDTETKTESSADTEASETKETKTERKCTVPDKPAKKYLVYKSVNGVNLRLFFEPPTVKVYDKAPVIVNIPGGGFASAVLMDYYRILTTEYDDIHKNGFATVTIEYRTYTEHKANLDEIVSDCMDAVRYLACYADVLEIDTDNIITFGHSAGGSLALTLGYAPHELFDTDGYWSDYDFHVSGVFAMSPPTDLTYKYDTSRVLCESIEMGLRTSPITYVTNGGVPCKVLMGTKDELVSPEGVQRFKDACDRGNVPCELIWLVNGDHGYHPIGGEVTPNYDRTRATITEFAKSCIK